MGDKYYIYWHSHNLSIPKPNLCTYCLPPGHTAARGHDLAHPDRLGPHALAERSAEGTPARLRLLLCHLAHRNGDCPALSHLHHLRGAGGEFVARLWGDTCYLLPSTCFLLLYYKKEKKEIIGRRGNRLRRIKARALDRKSGENSEQRTESSLWFPTARHMWELRTWPRPIFPGLKFSASWQLLFLVGHISKWTQFRAR